MKIIIIKKSNQIYPKDKCRNFYNLFPIISLSQTLTGTVKGSLGNPLQNANVIAKPLMESARLKFAIVDHLGRYKLELEKEVPYEVRVSYLGFPEEVLTVIIKTLIINILQKKHVKFM